MDLAMLGTEETEVVLNDESRHEFMCRILEARDQIEAVIEKVCEAGDLDADALHEAQVDICPVIRSLAVALKASRRKAWQQ